MSLLDLSIVFPKEINQIILKFYLDNFSMEKRFYNKVSKGELNEIISYALEIPKLCSVSKNWNEIVSRWILKNWPCHYYSGSYLDPIDSPRNTFFKQLVTVRKCIKRLYKTINGDKIVYQERLGSNSGENRNKVHILSKFNDKWFIRSIYTRVDYQVDSNGDYLSDDNSEIETKDDSSSDEIENGIVKEKPVYYLAEFFVDDMEIESPYDFQRLEYFFHGENDKKKRFSGRYYPIYGESIFIPFRVEGSFVCSSIPNDDKNGDMFRAFVKNSDGDDILLDQEFWKFVNDDVMETFEPNRYYW